MPATKEGDTLENRWLVQGKVGSSGRAVVYRGRHIRRGFAVAVKVEKRAVGLFKERRCHEYEMYKALACPPASSGPCRIPRVKDFLQSNREHIIIMDLLGPSIGDILVKQGRRFTLKTTLLVGIEMFYALDVVHGSKLIHGDLKPCNILTGRASVSNVLYLVDFGEAARYKGKNNMLLKRKTGLSFVGTPEFASLRAHCGQSQTPRDDLESLGYMLIFLYHGLPWEEVERRNVGQRLQSVHGKKEQYSASKLCAKLPPVFRRYFDYFKGLKFGEMPNYPRLRTMFRHALDSYNLSNDNMFEWQKSKISAHRSARV